jgi:hypothetical protein
MDTFAPSVSPEVIMDESGMPSLTVDTETSVPSTDEGIEATTSEPANSGGLSMNKVTVPYIWVAATTIFAGYL